MTEPNLFTDIVIYMDNDTKMVYMYTMYATGAIFYKIYTMINSRDINITKDYSYLHNKNVLVIGFIILDL